jgi:uncharacterized protein YndB with AHSA1/START domain
MSEDTRAQPHVVGTMRSENGIGVVRMEDRYDTHIDDLWSALTDPQRLARWIADVKGELNLGGTFQASFTSSWEGAGRIEVCEPPRRLLVTMDPGSDEETVIEAELIADGDQTRLVLEERGFTMDVVAAHGAGWQAHMEDLAAHLEGRERTDWRTRWLELAPSYREQAVGLADDEAGRRP